MSFLGGLPSENRSNFSVAAAAKKAGAGSTKIKPSTKAPALYTATHDTAPPSNQVISTEKTDLLFRKLMQKQEGMSGGHKREAADDKVEVQERRTKQIKTARTSDKGKERLGKEETDEGNAAEDEEEEEEEQETKATVVAEDDDAEAEVEEEKATREKTSRRKKPAARSSASRKKRKMDE